MADAAEAGRSLTFYLGTHETSWLRRFDVPLFVSRRRLGKLKRHLPRALTRWALDSGGFSELDHPPHDWTMTAAQYAATVRRYRDEIGLMDWAAPMDRMCEPPILAKTGRTVAQQQMLTLTNYLDLRTVTPDLPFIPVLQGWERDDYLRHVDLYERHGIDLAAEPVVGLGTVCRRSDTKAAYMIVRALAPLGLRLHGFGVKKTGLRVYGHWLTSADSLAWSDNARWNPDQRMDGCTHKTCANCPRKALSWRSELLTSLAGRWWQDELLFELEELTG